MRYTNIGTSGNLSILVADVETRFQAAIGHQRSNAAAAPTDGVFQGAIWCQSDYAWGGGAGDALKFFNGSDWMLFADPRYAQINAGGTVAMAADLPMGGKKITGLADGTSAGHAATCGQVMLLSGANAMAGNMTFAAGKAITSMGAACNWNGQRIENLGAPMAAGHAARKQDVDDAAPASGTVTHSGAAVNVTLGFTPARLVIFIKVAGGPKSVTLYRGMANNVATREVIALADTNDPPGYAKKLVDVTPRDGTATAPANILGFTLAVLNANGSAFAPACTVEWLAYRT